VRVNIDRRMEEGETGVLVDNLRECSKLKKFVLYLEYLLASRR